MFTQVGRYIKRKNIGNHLPISILVLFLCINYLGTYTFTFRRKMSIRSASKKHGLAEATVRHKITGYHGSGNKRGPKTVLTDPEETVLVNYIKLGVR